MNDLYAKVKKNDNYTKKDMRFLIAIVLVFCLVIAMVAFAVWFLGYQRRFSDFVGKLSDSTTYAYNNDSLTAKIDGKSIKVSEENMYGIFAYLSLNKSGKESRRRPEGEPVELDYGNGAILKLWNMSVDGNNYLFVQYIDKDGYIYSYISYKATLDTVVVRYLTYGNEEI